MNMLNEQRKHEQIIAALQLLRTRDCLSITEYEKKIDFEFSRYQYIIDNNAKCSIYEMSRD